MSGPSYQPPEEQQRSVMECSTTTKVITAVGTTVALVLGIVLVVVLVPGGPVNTVQKDLEMFPSSDSSLVIRLSGDNSKLVNDVKDRLKIYNNQAAGEYIDFDLEKLGPCDVSKVEYDSTKPCLFFQLPIRDNWKPEEITKEDFVTHKEELKDFKAFWDTQNDKNQYWVDCAGVSYDDKAALGNINYFPEERGIPKKYYPYKGDGKVYHSPLVAVQLDLNQRNVGETVEMDCNIYFKDVTPEAGGLTVSLKIEN